MFTETNRSVWREFGLIHTSVTIVSRSNQRSFTSIFPKSVIEPSESLRLRPTWRSAKTAAGYQRGASRAEESFL